MSVSSINGKSKVYCGLNAPKVIFFKLLAEFNTSRRLNSLAASHFATQALKTDKIFQIFQILHHLQELQDLIPAFHFVKLKDLSLRNVFHFAIIKQQINPRVSNIL